MYSPYSIDPWVVRIAEFCWGLANLCLLTFQRREKDLGILHRSWLRWKSAVWLGKSDLTDEHLVRTDKGVVFARSIRRLAELSLSGENLRAVVETPQRPKTTIADIPFAVEPLALPHAPPEAAEYAKEEPKGEQGEDDEMQGEAVDTKEAPGTSSSSRGEKRTETQENVPVKKRLMTKSPKRPVTPVLTS